MWMEWRAEASASRNMVYMAVLPPAGELRTTWASTSPFESRRRRGKYSGPPIATPVASSQFSAKAPCSCSTTGRSTRTSVSRQWPCWRPFPLHLPMRTEWKTAGALLSAILLALPLTAGAADKQITKAVETSLGRDPQLKKIDVRTDAGVVVLSGEVPNIPVSAKASEMAHWVDGVKSVKNELRVAQAKAN